jgi:hypothetical protein
MIRRVGNGLVEVRWAEDLSWFFRDNHGNNATNYACFARVETEDGLAFYRLVLGPILVLVGWVKA